MNAQERLRRKRKKQMQRRLSILVPLAVIILLIGGLTAGGIILSVNQTKKAGTSQGGSSEVVKNDDGNKGGSDERETPSADENQTPEASTEEITTEEQTQPPADDELFDTMLAQIRGKVAEDKTWLTAANSEFETIRQQLLAIDSSALTEEMSDLYDVLTDYMAIEAEGAAYKDFVIPSGQRACDVTGGVAYYEYLLRKMTGTDYDVQTIHDKIANELNATHGTVTSLLGADPMLTQKSSSLTKESAPDSYKFTNVTNVSDSLKAAYVCSGLKNGWAEFGLLRAYLLDGALDSSVKNYLVETSRMTYAMYGLLDYYVHHDGWTQAQVTELCVRYFGGDQTELAATVYNLILQNPGSYVAAALGYIEIASIESKLAQGVSGYSEQTLLDFLFARGPASFRVYHKWADEMVAVPAV